MPPIEVFLIVIAYAIILRLAFRYGYACSAYDAFLDQGYNEKSAVILALNWLAKREIISLEHVDPPEEVIIIEEDDDESEEEE